MSAPAPRIVNDEPVPVASPVTPTAPTSTDVHSPMDDCALSVMTDNTAASAAHLDRTFMMKGCRGNGHSGGMPSRVQAERGAGGVNGGRRRERCNTEARSNGGRTESFIAY